MSDRRLQPPLGGKQQGAQIRVLTLNHGEHQDSTLYRFEPGCYLQFCPAPSLLGRKVFLYTNYVLSNNQSDKSEQAEFIRNQYYSLEWHRGDDQNVWAPPTTLGTGILVQDTDIFCEILLTRAGSFHYYFVYENADSTIGPQGSGFFHVAPTLRYGSNSQDVLPLDCIQCQTVLAKSLGPITTWESKLRVAKESGYNMIHFTPVQELGDSNSSYSIANQLRLNPRFSVDIGREATFSDVENIVITMRNEWKMLSICDIVLNHTANESEWLLEHPEATYNVANCPHLRPALLLDYVLTKLTEDVGRGDYEHRGIPRRVNQNEHLDAIKHLLLSQLLPDTNIHELYICNINDIVQEFYHLARNKVPPVKNTTSADKVELKLVQDPQFRRLKSHVEIDVALQLFNVYRQDCYDEETRLKKCTEEFKKKLDELNTSMFNEIQNHLNAAVDNCIAGMRYFRIQSDGPKIEEVTAKNPLVPSYFTYPAQLGSLADIEEAIYSADGRFFMAHNGWVMNADPLQDFANVKDGTSNVYLRRELIAWGDSVKLRYGHKFEDSPFLWKHMREYVELTAEIFDGIRLDNCHSTPLHAICLAALAITKRKVNNQSIRILPDSKSVIQALVAEYMLDCARNVKPELYVVAELFTNSDQIDNIFVNRLGITSLIREALSAWDSHEQGRLVYRYGGRPVGAFLRHPRRQATPDIAHAIFLDLTHDNPSPIEKRSVFDLLPSSALVSMACCASGSSRGYDELVPHHIHVVDEIRQYAEWAGEYSGGADGAKLYVSAQTGIIAAKRALNQLHYDLGSKGYDQVYVDQMDHDVVAVTRHEPRSRQTVILVAFTAFCHPDPQFGGRHVKPLKFEGKLEEIVLEANLRHVDYRVNGPIFQKSTKFNKNTQYINGLSDYEVSVKQNIPLSKSSIFCNSETYEDKYTVLEFKNFLPGSVVAIRVSMKENTLPAFQKLHKFGDIAHLSTSDSLDLLGLTGILGSLTQGDYNALLYQCDQEDRDNGGIGVYDIPGYGPLVYSGLQGFISLLSEIRPNNDLGHALCNNLRDGNWMIDYVWQRLDKYPNLSEISKWYQTTLQPLKEIPRYLIPAYFDLILTGMYGAVSKACVNQMSDFVKRGTVFEKALALVSVQCSGVMNTATLPILSPHLPPPKPPVKSLTLSAGLPHFTTGYMRCWGRDTFISLRGMFMLTGRYQDARFHILGFAACLRHGLIPNLLDGGRKARFNCRDAVWWWLQSIKEYCLQSPQGYSILKEPVSRLYPNDDSTPMGPGQADQPLHDVMQEALVVHFQGLVFRERDAGRTIDAHMSDKGFNNQIGVNPETGFVFGGNEANCGTWMDKMGSSDAAGNRGKPATPRDGAAVEIVGLSKSVVSWLADSYAAGKYPYQGVMRKHRDGSMTTWFYVQWAERIQQNFERFFWVHTAPAATDMRPDLIHRRGIYKDSYGATQPWADYQLRCNFPIAMAVAPELFNPQHAWTALNNIKSVLVGPLGIKTLDPDDWAYCGDYDNSNQSADPKVAHGFNYHQGPEWVWPLGYYLRARLNFAQDNGCYIKTIAEIRAMLSAHVAEIQSNSWRGLPELTNSGGAYCADSCRTQAWSAATVLEVLHELKQWEQKQPLLPPTDDN